MSIKVERWGEHDGHPVDLFNLTNTGGSTVRITNYGAIIVSLQVPDRTGEIDDIVLGFDTLEEYIAVNPYFGAVVGRYCNRIGQARFFHNGTEYRLSKNDGQNHLHGGNRGFNKVIWEARTVETDTGSSLELSHLSRDGEEGYPGNLSVKVTYSLTDNNELAVAYQATTDKTTIINLSQHSYFNLAGAGQGSILDHELLLNADRFTPVGAGLIPTGDLQSVTDTPMDFREPVTIGARIQDDFEQLRLGGGYDHNWILNKNADGLVLAARVCEPTTGRVLDVLTDQPGIQFYSGNFLDGSHTGKKGQPYDFRTGFCLETQHFPDSPNKPDFPSVVLNPGQTFKQRTVFKFSTR